ncbi:MAG: hypothetical protein OHK0029_25380 [Armatimonadaceae bacterium]
MAYQSLYRKYRPQNFADVVGQQHVTRTLQNALQSGRVAHGYLFTGTRGTAKTTVARLLAKALNCESADHPVVEPCNQCAACRSITGGSSIDVIEMDAASHRGVADIEDVRKSVGYGPMELRYKVFIIDEAHQLSSDAKDAFLKTLEEPPANVVFVLATTEPQAIPITIRSRCQQFDFKRGSLSEISSRLKFVLDAEGVGYTPEAVNLVARGAEGSYRDSLSLLEQVLAFAPEQISAGDVQAVLGTLDTESLARVTQAVAERDAPMTFALAGQLLDSGKEARSLLKTLAAHFRDLLLVSVGGPAVSLELTAEEVGRLQQQARYFTPEQMMKAIDLLNTAQGETRWNNQHRLLVELTFLKLMELGPAAAQPFQVAPIIFAEGAEAVPTPVVAPASQAVRSPQPAPKVMVEAIAAPVAEPPIGEPLPVAAPVQPISPASRDDEELSPDFFADPADLEDDYEPGPPPDEPEDEPGEDPGTFDDEGPDDFVPPTPVAPVLSGGAAALREADTAPASAVRPAATPVHAPLTATEAMEAPDAPEPEEDGKQPSLFDIDDVYRAWSKFLGGMQKVSKATQVVMGRAQPTEVNHDTIEIVLPSRFHFDQMNDPKKQEVVRKLLAKLLGVERVQVRFSLSPDAAPRPTPRQEQKKKSVHDPLAALEALEQDSEEWRGMPALPPPPAKRPTSSPPVFAVSRGNDAEPAKQVNSGAPVMQTSQVPSPASPDPEWADELMEAATGHAELTPEQRNAALQNPLVQEVLQVFGGEVVKVG